MKSLNSTYSVDTYSVNQIAVPAANVLESGGLWSFQVGGTKYAQFLIKTSACDLEVVLSTPINTPVLDTM